MSKHVVVATLALDDAQRKLIEEELGDQAELVPLPETMDLQSRERMLRSAAALISRNIGKELGEAELAMISQVKLVQFVTSGVDFMPLACLPPNVPIASNRGAYAQPMAEHAMALALAASKRLLTEHACLTKGEFNMFEANRLLAGSVCGIFGFGGIGQAIAPLARAFGMKVHAINRRGHADVPVDWIATPQALDELLRASDVLVLCSPLTERTRGLIGKRELDLMKDAAILVNVARADIVDEAALYERLKASPRFWACIDAWWIEPGRHGRFATTTPLLTLPNVIGSPHNSASVPGAWAAALKEAARNVRRALEGNMPARLVPEEERAYSNNLRGGGVN
ncbi:MAG TPA: NAD(P)-dependent oxidoreductase [Ramlibacter sp.]|uniref:NAD(P)-dependent oxidoreductase n=1 Tax=Ramlibacter sp. TaxID=1917967 RepID=UPI002BF01BE8|nr:NAD(P)-dependent oxidoreductase [Ramlibacter sp.]HVZ46545.1 NAD(P)-dependent oxidoreductase [Ramlibacter sp.]